jgi:UDP-N-acetylmuramoyl-L-alanyl-D-glutamate--2,6-diaminopimelate ligase
VEIEAEGAKLADLAALVGGRVVGSPETRVTGVTHDSRRIRPGDLFAAVPGFERDGHAFVPETALAGAGAVLVQRESDESVPAIVVDDVRRALGPIAHAIWGYPTRDLVLAGVTGTNGKTTTSFLMAAILREVYGETPILGTLGIRRAGGATQTGFTTPEAPDLARVFAGFVDEGVRAVSMEVSSHALELGRVRGVDFAAGAFTNLSVEHLDFHGTLEAYGRAKLIFFEMLAEEDAFAVVNADDPWGDRFRAVGPPGTWRYSLEDPRAEVFAERFDPAPDGSRITVRTPEGSFETRLHLPGRWNVANALAAAAVGVGLGIEPERIGAALATVERVPGRYEVYVGGGVTAIVDYAHTPLAFERILKAVRQSGAERVFCIFGCGGERDRTKRPEMARIAGAWADFVYLTVDNPRREPIDQIMNDTLAGFAGASARWERIDDRAAAIRRAIAEARPGDVVCLLGKGDEEYQMIGTTKHPHSDREIAIAALAERERAR